MLNCRKSQCPGAKRIGSQLHYLRNSQVYKDKAAKWREENADRYQQRLTNYFSREDVKARMREKAKQWSTDNPDRKRETDKTWREANRDKDRANKARYRAATRKATPPWLTDEHRSQTLSYYTEAERLTYETGVEHEVDHIIPLQAGSACGLHVPWNLRVVTRDVNNRRPRKWTSDELTALGGFAF